MKLRKAALQRIKELEFQLHRARLILKGNSFSKLGEQQLLRKYIEELLPENHDRIVVDIGAGDGIRMSNSYALFTDGWRGVGVEFDPRKAARLANAYKFYEDVSVCRCQVTPENIIPLLAAFNIPNDFSILSLDIDSYDLPVLNAILSNYRPRIVVTEINEKIPPPIRFYVKFDPALRLHHHFYGYSIKTLEDLCAARGYAIIDLEFNNAFIAPKELAKGRELSAEEAYHKGYLDRPDRREKFRPNENMEVLHSMTPGEVIEFLNNFYIRDQGNYEISVDEVIGIEPHNK